VLVVLRLLSHKFCWLEGFCCSSHQSSGRRPKEVMMKEVTLVYQDALSFSAYVTE
jgi:hypothetical protein